MYFLWSKQVVFLAVLFTLTLFAHLAVAPDVFSESIIFGDRRFAFFDLWTLQHVLSGVIVGFLILFLKNGIAFKEYLISILLVAFLWELFEVGMEHGLMGQVVADWKFGYEFILNRVLVDPLSVLIGGILQWHFKNFVYVSLPLASLWLLANIFSAHSMSIQEIIFS